MADNVPITAGTGTSIATDDAGAGGHVQIIKLAVSSDGSATLIPADGTAGLKVDLGADNDVTLNAGSNAIGKLAANSGVDIGDVDVTSSALPAGASTSAKQDTVIGHLDGVEGILTTIDGDTGTLAAAVTSNKVQVDVISAPTLTVNSHAVTNAGTFAVQGTAVGTVADDSTTPGAPVMIGGKAVETDGTDPTSVSAEDDVAIARTDRTRRLLVSTVHPRLFSVSADYASAQTNASVKAAPGAGLSLYITDIQLSNGATAGNITLLDGSGGTVLYEVYPAINGGAVMNLNTPIRLTANTALCITSTTVTTHSVFVSGYIAP